MMKFAGKLKVQLPLALGLALVSNYSMKLPANSTDQPIILPAAVDTASAATDTPKQSLANTMAIQNIYVNESKQLVVEFDNPAHINPIDTQIKDYPGQKHDIVLEFLNTSFAVDKAPKAKALLNELMKVYPDLNSVAYATAIDGTRARIRIGVSPNISAHPSLVKIEQDLAIINLDLPQVSKVVVASNDNVVDTNNSIAENKTAPVIVATTAATANTQSASEKSIKAKTVHGIKNAWTSSIVKINPLSKFGHNKSEQLSTPVNTGIAVTPVIDEKIAVSSAEKKVAEPVAVEQSTSKIDLIAALNEPIDVSAHPADISKAKDIQTPTSINPLSVPTLVATNSEISKTEIASLKPEITSTATETAIAIKEPTPLKDNQLTTAIVTTTAEKTSAELPKIATSSEGNKASEEPIVTPLSVEPVLNKKTNLQTVDAKSAVPAVDTVTDQQTANTKPVIPLADNITDQPAANTKPVIPLADNVIDPQAFNTKPAPALADNVTDAKADNVLDQPVALDASPSKPVISDLRTNSSKTEEESADKKNVIEKLSIEDKKEETEKIASLPQNPLDSLTSAAINNNAKDESSTEDTSQTAAAIKLKSQKAHAGGKDYFPPKFADDAVDHYNAAVRAHLSGKLTEAITEYQAAIEADEKIGEAYSNLGLIYNQLHKYDQAMVEFHKALAINPKDAITYNGIGAAMRAKNNLLAAIKNWQTAIVLDPNLASAHYNLGTAYELNKDLEKALGQYKEAVKHDDKLGEAYYRMGLILQKMNNKNLALEEYKRAIKISQQASYASDAKRRINLLSQSKNNVM